MERILISMALIIVFFFNIYYVCNDQICLDQNTVNCECNEAKELNFTEEIFTYDLTQRMGPILLKFDKEWLIKDQDKYYLQIALSNKGYETQSLINDYDLISLKAKSASTSNKTLYYEYQSGKKIDDNVIVYKILCDEQMLWIDLKLVILIGYDIGLIIYRLQLSNAFKLYFYHPLKQKWLGLHHDYSSERITRILFSDLYNKKNTKDDIEKKLRKVTDFETKIEIINKRTLQLPNMKFYEDKLESFQSVHKMYSWYVEREEIAPKDEDE